MLVWVPWKCSRTRNCWNKRQFNACRAFNFDIPVDLCVGPQPSPQKYPSLQRWNPPPGFLWSHAATERGPKWGTALGYTVLLQALEEAARSRRYGGEIFCWIWGLRFHGRIWGVEGSGRIQIIVYQFLAILISLKLERLKLDEIHRIIQESQWETWLNILI